MLKNRFPDKPIVLAEVGWPSEGCTRYDAVASASNEALFLRRFLYLAEQENYVYYLMEAFDQPWKRRIEGEVGAYWGIYNVEREPKFPFHEPIVRIPEWPLLASISVTFGVILLSLLFITNHSVNTEGKTFLAIIVYGLVTLVSLLIYDYTNQYLTFSGMIVGIIMLIFMTGIITMILSEAHEWIEAHWISHRRRTYKIEPSRTERFPMVSIHVPLYNEPPEMVIETLNALSRLQYPNFEVCVVDNNTSDENIWKPVENHCLILGQRFNFYHVNPLAGFKAGALNYALQHTSADAEILAYIDSDYIVDPSWLKDLVPAFNNNKVSIVQAPQDYRDADQSVFKAMCYAEYCGFFHIGMITRNDRNAIIQHGTMTMVRRSTMEKLGGWAEWCITEDAELGLRVFEHGLEACYVPRSYGKGLIPDTFIDYKKQRYRWVYGAVQILKNHTRKLFIPGGSKLSAGQRYHFIAGWLPWFAESLNLLFVIFSILWSVAMIYFPETIDSPSIVFSLLPITFFVFKLLKLIHLYRKRIGASVTQIVATVVAGLSLSHTIGLAMIHGLLTKNQPFIRTPKQAKPYEFLTVFGSAKEEFLIFIALGLSIFTLATTQVIVSPDYKLWLVLLSVQSLPYAATVITSLISAFPVRTGVLEANIQKSKVLIAQSGE